MKIRHLSLSALALSLALSQAPMAFAHHDVCEHKHDWIVKASEKVGLNADQKTKITALADKAKADVKVRHEELKAVQDRVNDSFRSGDISDSKIDEFVNQEQQTMGAILKIRMKERYDAYMLLDASQKEKMNVLVQKWKEHHQHVCASE